MKAIGNILFVALFTYLTVVPPKIDKRIEAIQYSKETIFLDLEIKTKISNIEKEKEKIYLIQKELDNN